MNYEMLASDDSIAKTIKGLAERNVEAEVLEGGAKALERIQSLIPKGASVMNGSSRTLEQIGYIDYLKSGKHGWDNLHEAIVAESDKAKQSKLRKQAALSDYYLGSIHGLAETGEFIVASNSGSQLPHIVFTSPNVIFVVSTKKIVPTLADAMQRLETHVVPLEDQNMMTKYNIHTYLSKIVIFRREFQMSARKIRMLLVKENLGF